MSRSALPPDDAQQVDGGLTGASVSGTAPAAQIRVGHVRVRDFRNLADVCVELEPDTTVLVGENNTGKTSFLEALEVAIGGRRAVEDDLLLPSEGPRQLQFTVDLTIVPSSGNKFDSGVVTLFGNAVTRTDGGELVALRATGSPNPDGSGISVRHVYLQGWDGCRGADLRVQEMSQPRPSRRILDLLAFHLLDARRDLVEELRNRRSPWGRLLAQLQVPDEVRVAIETSLAELGDQVVGGSVVLSGVATQLASLSTALGSSIADVSLVPLPGRVDEIARAVDVHVTAPRGPSIPLRQQGMGSRSLAALAVFRAFVDLRLGLGQGLRPLPITALEEPEAHLHPQAQGAVAASIKELAGQKIISTHAPRIVRSHGLTDLRFFRRESTGIQVRQVEKPYSADELVTVERLVLRPHGETLFARLVIIGDGATEAAALPVFGRAHWGDRDVEGLGVSIMEVTSLGDPTVPALVAALDDLGIPWLIFADGDDAAARHLGAIGDRIGRQLLDDTSHVVRLPDGQGMERHLIKEGPVSAITSAVLDFYGPEALTKFRADKGWTGLDDEELLFRFLNHHKGSYGAVVAGAVVEERRTSGRSPLPDAFLRLFERTDEILAGA